MNEPSAKAWPQLAAGVSSFIDPNKTERKAETRWVVFMRVVIVYFMFFRCGLRR
jgi:hypothetical protein